MTANKNQLLLGIAGAVLCFLQLSDAQDIWRAGHPLVTAVIVAAALVGTAFAVSDLLRPAAPLPASPGDSPGLQGFLTGRNGVWNPKLNASFLCYFVAAIASSLVEPWGLRSLSGIVGVLGLAGTIVYAIRARRVRKRA